MIVVPNKILQEKRQVIRELVLIVREFVVGPGVRSFGRYY